MLCAFSRSMFRKSWGVFASYALRAYMVPGSLLILSSRSLGVSSPLAWSMKETPPVRPSPMMAGGLNTVALAAGISSHRMEAFCMMESRESSGVLRLSQGSSWAMHMPRFSPLPPMKLNPEVEETWRTPGMLISFCSALRMACSVRPSVAPGASWISQKTVPLSSGGRKDLGTVSNSFQLPTRTAASRISVSHARRTMMPAHLI